MKDLERCLRNMCGRNNMIEAKTWDEFRESGLMWFVNNILHLFGWAIVVNVDDNNKCTNAYPARVKFRGFSEDINTEGYIKVSNYLKDNINDLAKEANS